MQVMLMRFTEVAVQVMGNIMASKVHVVTTMARYLTKYSELLNNQD